MSDELGLPPGRARLGIDYKATDPRFGRHLVGKYRPEETVPELLQCGCPSVARSLGRCVQRATQEDRRCDECRAWCTRSTRGGTR